jgi:PiT family inorganic phosphate transporter
MGDWRIIRTLGKRMSDIQGVQGFTAETTSAAVILTSTHLRLPLSTTQACTGSILGAVAGRPARIGALGDRREDRADLGLHPAGGGGRGRGRLLAGRDRHRRRGVVGVTGVAVASGIYNASRRTAVTAANVNDVPRRPLADLVA